MSRYLVEVNADKLPGLGVRSGTFRRNTQPLKLLRKAMKAWWAEVCAMALSGAPDSLSDDAPLFARKDSISTGARGTGQREMRITKAVAANGVGESVRIADQKSGKICFGPTFVQSVLAVGPLLFRIVKDCSKTQKAEELHIHGTPGADAERSDKLLNRLGLKVYGGNYAGRAG